jgi:hypothetical protein
MATGVRTEARGPTVPGVTTVEQGARAVPARGGGPRSGGSVVDRDPEAPVKGSGARITRCTIHGIAFDSERETCPDCAKGPSASQGPSRIAPSG